MTSGCRGLADDLSLYAYGFLEGDECAAVEEHLRNCPHCREMAERLLRERDLVAFELSLETGVGPTPGECDPAPTSTPEPGRPRRRLRVLAFAAAAALLVLATVTAWFASRPEAPGEIGWRDLPDGSRYRVIEVAAVSLPKELRRLEMDSGSLILDVRRGDDEFAVETPCATVLCEEGRFAVSVVPSGTVVEVLAGQVRVEPVEGGVETVVPGESGEVRLVFVEVDPNPDLLARIQELEEKLRDLGELEPALPEPLTPQDAIEGQDWGALAGSYAEIGQALREGRLPQDPAVLRRYLKTVEGVRRLAEAVGVEPTMEAIARDPRTGPKIFAANVARLWPDAPVVDIDAAEADAARALTEYAGSVAAATSPEAERAAQTKLEKDLTESVERIEDIHGPATEVEVKVPVIRPTKESTDPGAEEATPAPTRDDAPDDDPEPEVKEQSSAERVLEATGLVSTRTVIERRTTPKAVR
jgi:FecR protein/Putative zinc-finger